MSGMVYNNTADCNFLFIISAPSGTGKTTLCNYLLKKHPDDLALSISATTRKPRKGEIDGKSYFFITKDEYLARVNVGGFLEHAQVFDNYYGTPLDFVHNKISNGFNIIFDIDWQGMRQIKAVERFNVVTVFLVPPSLQVLRERLHHRGDSPEQIEKRVSGFQNDAEKANEYDYVLINGDLQAACDTLDDIYKAECARFQRTKNLNFIGQTLANKNLYFS